MRVASRIHVARDTQLSYLIINRRSTVVRPSRLQASIYGEYDASFFTPRPTRRGGATRGSRVSRETAVCTAQCELRSTPAGEKLEVSVIRMSYSMVLKVQDTAWRSPIAALKARHDLEHFVPKQRYAWGRKPTNSRLRLFERWRRSWCQALDTALVAPATGSTTPKPPMARAV